MFDALWQGVVVHELKLKFLQQVPSVYVLTVSAIIGHNHCGECMAS